MKSLTSLITVSLMLATGTALAHEQVKDPAPPAAAPQTMDHGKMDMQQGQMDRSKMDMSGNKSVDHQKMAAAQFAKLDANKDGSLSKAEFAKHHEMMGMQHGQMDRSKMDAQEGQMDHSKMGMPGMNAADHQKMAMEQFAKLDTNQDGKLSKTEIPDQHPLAAHFDMLDTNKDGSLSKAEFAKHDGM